MSSGVSGLSLHIPSKTFLLGEYAVLHGGPAIVLAHAPRFCLRIQKTEDGAVEGFHPMSPAGQWMRRNLAKFSSADLRFLDPHQSKGGFGASSAQFVGVFAWSKLPEGKWHEFSVSAEDLWRTFKSLDHGRGQAPSGADVVAQALGGVTVFESTPFKARSFDWPFKDLVVVLARTGEKLATHDHLRERLPVSDHLIKLAKSGVAAFVSAQENEFVRLCQTYANELERLQLVTVNTRGLIAQVAANSFVLAVKGCGAMGADVLAVLVPRVALDSTERMLNGLGLEVISSTDRLEQGLTLEAMLAPRMQFDGEPWA